MNKEYLVREYQRIENKIATSTDEVNPTERVITKDQLWKLIDDARDNDRKIVIYEVGECLLDWS